MSYAIPAPRAPYAIYIDGRLIERAKSLFDLHAALLKHENKLAGDELYVIDAANVRREDLRRSFLIRWHFADFGTLSRSAADFGWDGDFRPRGRPIPGTGVRRRGRSYRRPATQSERRYNQPLFDEGEPEIRGARKIHVIVNAWDDIWRDHWNKKSWKRFRRTQWR